MVLAIDVTFDHGRLLLQLSGLLPLIFIQGVQLLELLVGLEQLLLSLQHCLLQLVYPLLCLSFLVFQVEQDLLFILKGINQFHLLLLQCFDFSLFVSALSVLLLDDCLQVLSLRVSGLDCLCNGF